LLLHPLQAFTLKLPKHHCSILLCFGDDRINFVHTNDKGKLPSLNYFPQIRRDDMGNPGESRPANYAALGTEEE
jgi:hypothetical protein